MNSMEEWQLDAIEGAMRRCDALSDFSTEQIASTLEQMGFTIARRTPIRAAKPDGENCARTHKHRPHTWYSHTKPQRCSGEGKPSTQKRGPSISLVIRDEVPALSGTYTFVSKSAEEPATPKYPSVGSQWVNVNRITELATVDEVNVLAKRLVFHTNADQANTNDWTIETFLKNYTLVPPDPFSYIPVDSSWIRRIPSENQSNECRIIGVFFKNFPEGKQFYVNYMDGWDDAKVSPLDMFVGVWERI